MSPRIEWTPPGLRALYRLHYHDGERVDAAVQRYAATREGNAYRLPGDDAATVRLAVGTYRIRATLDDATEPRVFHSAPRWGAEICRVSHSAVAARAVIRAKVSTVHRIGAGGRHALPAGPSSMSASIATDWPPAAKQTAGNSPLDGDQSSRMPAISGAALCAARMTA